MDKRINSKLSLQTRLAQALRFLDPETGSVVPAIQPTATYARDENYEVRKPYWYRRDGNQTTTHAEALISELELNERIIITMIGKIIIKLRIKLTV